MSEPAVLQATFADWRTVKGRKQLQLIFEVPIEQQAHVLSVLGAPLGDSATWVAIARLQAPTAPPEHVLHRSPAPPAAPPQAGAPDSREQARETRRNPDAADRARESYRADNEMGKAARLAGMLRKDPQYQEWLAIDVCGRVGWSPQATPDLQRYILKVDSCSEIATDPLAYERWKQHLLAFEMATGRAARPS